MDTGDKSLYSMIYKRKSFHLFRNIGDGKLTPDRIRDVKERYKSFTPLYPGIRTAIKIVPACETTCRRGQEYCILLYSEKKDNYLQNIGYLGEQLDLYLVSQNIGTLWYGVGKTNEPSFEGLDFVIMMAISEIGDSQRFRKDMFKSKRRPVEEIWMGEPIPGVTEIVRFAPSACNTQPWLVRHTGRTMEVFRYKKPGRRGIMPAAQVSYYNRIDIGIFLYFLDLCLEHNNIRHHVKLYDDFGGDDETTLIAAYELLTTQSAN